MEVHSGIYICNAIVSTVDYGLLLAAKLIGRADNPFTLQIGGIRILLVVWLVKLVILGLLLAEIEYNPANAVRFTRKYITNHTAASRLGVTVLPRSVEDAIAWFKIQPHPNILFLDIKLSSACSAYFNGKIILHVKPPHKDKITVSEEKVSSFKLWLNL